MKFLRLKKGNPAHGLSVYGLTGIGIGGIIGAGFFLGLSLAVNQAGPSVILAFLLGGFIMTQVLGAMSSISINEPEHGTFRVYTERYLGKFSGFLIGWMVFVSGALSIASEAVASGIFLKYFLPAVPQAVLSILILLLVVFINRMDVKNFGNFESGMSSLKILVLIFFIIVGIISLAVEGIPVKPNPFVHFSSFFPNGIGGFFQCMLIVIFTYSGINAFDMASIEVDHPKRNIPKASILLTIGIVGLYVTASTIVVASVPWNTINVNTSPFVQSLAGMGITFAAAVFNVGILVATVSVMAGTYFSCTKILSSLAQSGQAPPFFANASHGGFHRNSWVFTGGVGFAITLFSFVLGDALFNYLVSACSYFWFINWFLSLLTYLVWRKQKKAAEYLESPLILGKTGAYVTMALILLLTMVSLEVRDFRIGFYISIAALASICSVYLVLRYSPKIAIPRITIPFVRKHRRLHLQRLKP